MTDVLAKPTSSTAASAPSAPGDEEHIASSVVEPATEPGAAAATGARSNPPIEATPAQWLTAALLLGAGLIHAAMAPSHLGESAVEGAGFVVAAWAQIALGVAVVVRPARWVNAAIVASNLALVAVWAVSRTAGLPFGAHAGHAETVSIVDGVTVALELAAVLVATGVVARLVRVPAVALAGAAGALVFASVAIASPAARDHASGSHGEHGDGDHAAAADHGDGDHAVAAGNGAGGDEAHHADMGADDSEGHDDAAHGVGGATTDDLGFSELNNGHQHESGADEPLTPEETVALSQQLAATAELVELYPTIADAEAAGWTRAGPFTPGLGTHYMGPSFAMNPDGDMDPEDLLTPMLVFDGLGQDAPLAGFMYLAYGTTAEPTGFAGPNDHWHYHENVCIVTASDGTISTPFGADMDGVTQRMCSDVGGSLLELTGYMAHVWNVPGYESPDGMFTELNRRITCPDGTYHRMPIEELGNGDTTCLNS